MSVSVRPAALGVPLPSVDEYRQAVQEEAKAQYPEFAHDEHYPYQTPSDREAGSVMAEIIALVPRRKRWCTGCFG